MASKGQKFIRFTDEERTEVVGQYLSGQCFYKSIAKDRGVSWKTIESMVRKYRNTETTISEQKGRPKEKHLTKEDWKERFKIE